MSDGPLADVAVLAPLGGRDSLTYAIPDDLRDRLREGARVVVPLGRRRVTGIVIGRGAERPTAEVKTILDLLDDEPILSAGVLRLCRFAARYYLTSLSQVLNAVVFAGLRAESVRTVRRIAGIDLNAVRPPLRAGEHAVLERLPEASAVGIPALVRALRSSSVYPSLRALANRGLVVIDESLAPPRAATLEEGTLFLADAPTSDTAAHGERRAPAQRRILGELRGAGASGLPIDHPELRKSPAAVRALVAKGLVRLERREIYRELRTGGVGARDQPTPNSEQQTAIAAILAANGFETFLLHGVTGSGKTEVYLRVAESVLGRGRGVLLLVPEIALTHELVHIVRSRFGNRVALLHSALSPGERWDEWRRLARGEARIALGVRSAVFAPVPDLGLVIVDEEHDGAYKQEEGLRYHARDLAVVRGRDAGCPVVLGSATPSIESHANAENGRYRLLELTGRVEGRALPAVELIDLRVERPEGDPPIFAPRLSAALAENLAGGSQSLVFLNRRGYAPYLQCTLCGHVMQCPNCSVTLTFHLRERRLRCHHCDHRQRSPEVCPACTSPSLRDFGFGTEQAEAALHRLFPNARIARMDRDTTTRKRAIGEILDAWRAGSLDILIGTQMVAKGHDIPGVTLVCVVLADQALNFPDFRAAERTFQLLSQVSGRAGRGDRPGRVLIQTYRPEHYALALAVEHDYRGFAERECRLRQALDYPPFARLVNVRLDGIDAAAVEEVAQSLAGDLRRAIEPLPRNRRPFVLGPAPAPIERRRGRYRWQILLKGKDPGSLQQVVRGALGLRAPARVRIAVDVDPQSML